MTTMLNGARGRRRPSLADQIDRLDRVLDGLAEGLSEAVAAAVEQAVGQAVQVAVARVLTDADLRERLAVTPLATPPQPGWCGGLTGALRQRIARAADTVRAVAAHGVNGVGRLATWASAVLQAGVRRWLAPFGRLGGTLHRGWQGVAAAGRGVRRLLTRPVGLAVAVGLVLGVAGHLAGPLGAAVIDGVCGAGLTLAAWALTPLGRLRFAAAPVVDYAGLASPFASAAEDAWPEP